MKDFFTFKNLDSESDATLSIHDEIGFWGTNAKAFHSALKSIKGSKLSVHINSPGGNVIDGYAIYNMLRASGKEVTVMVDGIAASIASVIAMAGSKIKMPENALMFIHDPLVNTEGNAAELKKVAADLEKLKEGILCIYEARTGSDRAKISKMMSEETLMTAKECKLMGFADEVLPENKAAAKANFLVTDYHPTIKLPAEATTASVGRKQETNDNTMTEAEQQRLDAALEQVRVLKGENSTLTNAVTEARNKAQQDAIKAENTRKDAIKAHAAKYNKDGDLNEIVINALADSSTTLDQFKDSVTDVIAKRSSSTAIKKGESAGAEDSFEAKYKAAKTDSERRQLVRENKAEARKLLRSARS